MEIKVNNIFIFEKLSNSEMFSRSHSFDVVELTLLSFEEFSILMPRNFLAPNFIPAHGDGEFHRKSLLIFVAEIFYPKNANSETTAM